MGDRVAKDALYAEFAAVGKVLGHAKRLELIDLLAQSPRSVEDLADAADLALSTCSAHLQALREADLLQARREGRRVYYALRGDDVAALWEHLRRVARRHRPGAEMARRTYLGPEDTEAIDSQELLRRLRSGETVVVDVRPEPEYAEAHLPGAVHIPVEQLAERLAELPRDKEIVAYCRGEYCVLAHEAVRLLSAHGFNARRAAEGALEWRLSGLLDRADTHRAPLPAP